MFEIKNKIQKADPFLEIVKFYTTKSKNKNLLNGDIKDTSTAAQTNIQQNLNDKKRKDYESKEEEQASKLQKIENSDVTSSNKCSQSKENWIVIPETKDMWEISNHGNVRKKGEKINRACYTRYGSKKYACCYPNGQKEITIKLIVYGLFVGPISSKETVIHIDNNPENNYWENLKKVKKIRNNKYNINEEILEEGEEIKDIQGFEGRYMITSTGRVFSKLKNVILRPANNGGYLMVELSMGDGKSKPMSIHRLMAENFHTEIAKGQVVDHIDRNTLNNKASNLRICSASENNKNQTKREGYGRHILRINSVDDSDITEYVSLQVVCDKNIGVDKKLIQRNLKGEIDLVDEYIWVYKNEYLYTKHDNENFVNIGIFEKDDLSDYECSETGIVRCISKKTVLSAYDKGNGYLNVDIKTPDKDKAFKVHRLIAFKYVPGYRPGLFVNHKDFNRQNNHCENLEWLTPSQNSLHARGKRVNQIDPKTGEILKTFNSLSEANQHVGVDKSSGLIGQACKGKVKIGYGYKWSYAD